MSIGKASSQSGHAYLDAYLKCLETNPALAGEYKGERHGIKVCLRAKRLEQLIIAEQQAIAAGIPCALITDCGWTCFNNVPTITALGIGPARKDEIKHITKKFQLYGN